MGTPPKPMPKAASKGRLVETTIFNGFFTSIQHSAIHQVLSPQWSFHSVFAHSLAWTQNGGGWDFGAPPKLHKLAASFHRPCNVLQSIKNATSDFWGKLEVVECGVYIFGSKHPF